MKNLKYVRGSNGQYAGAYRKDTRIIVSALIIAAICVAIAWIFHEKPLIVPVKAATVPHGYYDLTSTSTRQEVYNQAKAGTLKWYNPQGEITDKQDGLTFTATVTAYSSRVQETDSTPEIGATGQNIYKLYLKHDNTCASNDYSFGMILVIPGLGTCTIRDRMNQRYNGKGHIDFYMGYNTKQALQFGKQQMEVIIKN